MATTTFDPLKATYADVSNFAAEIYSNLVRKYEGKGNQFVDGVREHTGLMYRCIGSVGMLLLVNAFDGVGEDRKWQDIALDEFRKTTKYIEENGFDATPVGTADRTKKYFSPKGSGEQYSYLDTVSWALAFALQMRLAQRQNRITLEDEDGRAVWDMIRRTVEILVESVTEQGGWGFTKGCTKPDLYFSYCVSEALADFGDYILGEAEELQIEKDTDLVQAWPVELIGKVYAVRRKTLDWLTATYLGSLGEKEITVDRGDAESRYLDLYGTFFVIDMLIINDPDPKQESEEQKAQRKYQSKRIERAVEHAIYLSRIDFDKAYEDRAWWEDSGASSLSMKWSNHPTINLQVPTDLKEPGLVPLSLRCNALYAYYVAKGWDQRLARLFELVCEDRNDDGLWDEAGDNLVVTERSIEAIVDFADSLKAFDRPEPVSSSTELPANAFAVSALEEAIRQIVRDETATALVSLKSEVPSAEENPIKLDEATLLDQLSSALATTSNVLRDLKSESMNPSDPNQKPQWIMKDLDRLDRSALSFCKQLQEFAAELLAAELRPHVGEGDPNNVTAKALRSQQESLAFWLADWLGTERDARLSELLGWVSERLNKTSGPNAKTDNRGGKR